MRRRDKKAVDEYLKKLEFISQTDGANPDETDAEKTARIERAKKDPAYMVEYYFSHYAKYDCADFHLEFATKIKRKKSIKAFAQWGRGLAKSVWADVFIPFWLWLNGETVYLVIVGQNARKAEQLLDDIRAEFEANPRIIHDFGEQKRLGSWEADFWMTEGGFIGQSLGLGQSCRGLRVRSDRPTLIVCDDLETRDKIKNPQRQDEYVLWIERDLLPCMDGEYRRFIYANNRFAPRMVQTQLQEKHPKWFVHNIAAYDHTTFLPRWNAKYSDTYYKEWEDEIGSLAARAEFNNAPHVEGKIFKAEQIQWAKLPRIDHFDALVGHWDIAYAGTKTSDYNAIRIWGCKDGNFYYVDSFVMQSKMKAALEWAAMYQKSLPEGVEVYWRYEGQFWNDEVNRTISDVEKANGLHFRFSKVNTPRTNKLQRIMSMQPYYQNGRIFYNRKKKDHTSTQIGLAQLYAIEPGYKSHDDSPDADEQAIKYLEQFIYGKDAPDPIVGSAERKYNY